LNTFFVKVIDHINTKLHTILPTGMYMAACMLVIDSQLQQIQVWNGGMPDIYLLDGESGNIRERAVSRCMPLGIKESVDEACCFQQIAITQGESLLMHSDGITDAQNQTGAMFGSHELELFIERAETGEQAFHTLVDLFSSPAAPWQTTDDVTMVHIPLMPQLSSLSESGAS